MPTAIFVTVGSGPGANTPIVFSPRLEVKTSWLSSLTSAPATAPRPATEKRCFARRRIEHVDGVVGGVRDIDVAGRVVDGGVVETAAAVVRRQRHVAVSVSGAVIVAPRGPRSA